MYRIIKHLSIDRKVVVFILFVVFTTKVFCQTLRINTLETGIFWLNQYDRVFQYGSGAAITTLLNLNDMVTINAGVSFISQRLIFSYTAAAGIDTSLWLLSDKLKNFHTMLYYYHTNIPVYNTSSHAIIPAFGYTGKIAGILLGSHIRWSNFFGVTVPESMISFKTYLTFFQNNTLLFRLLLSNFNTYYAGNTGNWHLGIDGDWIINKYFKLSSSIALFPSGGMGLSSTFFGITGLIGIKTVW